jgi:hypothetical protein
MELEILLTLRLAMSIPPRVNFYWLTTKNYIADISYKNIFFYICLKNRLKVTFEIEPC